MKSSNQDGLMRGSWAFFRKSKSLITSMNITCALVVWAFVDSTHMRTKNKQKESCEKPQQYHKKGKWFWAFYLLKEISWPLPSEILTCLNRYRCPGLKAMISDNNHCDQFSWASIRLEMIMSLRLHLYDAQWYLPTGMIWKLRIIGWNSGSDA